jgi:hypothetical protein
VQLAPKSTTRHLPSDLNDYEDELDQNGNWTYEEPYGNVWVPYGIGADWRPYLYGCWDWYPAIGWTWISSEPWGWPVYHYGRWSWRFGLGWYWIPDYHWGPAWVHWWWNDDYIGWCPLSWYNRPDVIINNRFYDRYRDRDFPVGNRALTVVRRNQLRSPDLARHALRGGELGRIDRIALTARQPAFESGLNRGALQAPGAERVFSAKPGIQREVRSFSSGTAASPSRLRPGNAIAPARNSGITRSNGTREAVSRESSGGRLNGSGAVRSDRSIRVYPPSREAGAARGSGAQRRTESGMSGARMRSSGAIREYPSRLRDSSQTAGRRSLSPSGAARNGSSRAIRRYASRLNEGGQSSGRRSSRPYSSYNSSSSSRGRVSQPFLSSSRGRSSSYAPARSRWSNSRSSYGSSARSARSMGRSSYSSRGRSSSVSRSSGSSRSSSSSRSHSSSRRSGGSRKTG